MSFQLRVDKSFGKDLRRLMRKQIERAIEELSASQGFSRDKVVHETRKRMKKVRAVLRLVRPCLDNATYKKANANLRDAARPLAAVRDAKILIETTDKLANQFKDRVAGRTFGSVRKALESHARSTRRQVLNKGRAFAHIRKMLRDLQPRIKDWSDVPDKWSSIGEGLSDTYDNARSAFDEAAADPQPEKLHEWRKQAKYLRYQLELLRPAWPERVEELAHEADSMGEQLGDDHDLTLLRQRLSSDGEHCGEPDDVQLLLALIEHRQLQLRQEAMLLGKRFFEQPPVDFAGRLKQYWRTWRRMDDAHGNIQFAAASA